ncbi:MAG TPA: hypothetical protein VF263_13440, partial [Longimicrobiaceae bacterium]
MSMDALHVSRLRARYRLPAGETDARARLDRVLRDVVEEALEHALARAGVATHEEVCIRHVHAPARLRLGAPDSTLTAEWSMALAEAIRAAIRGGGPDVVRYGSRAHALVDLLTGVAAGDLRRAWAWRQVGLWRAGEEPSGETAAEEAARALLASPESVVAALAAAARAGALPALAARVRPAAWVALARTALQAAGAPAGLASRLFDFAAEGPGMVPGGRGGEAAGAAEAGAEPGSGGAAPSPLAVRVARDSRLARALGEAGATDAAAPLPRDTRRALAVLALLEAEPTAVRRGAAETAALAAEVERETVGEAGEAGASRRERAGEEPRRPGRGAERPGALAEAEAEARSTRRAPLDRSGPVAGVEAEGGSESPAEPRRADGASSDRAPGRTADAGANAGADVDVDPDAGEERPLPEVRRSGETRWGGLLFLLHLLDVSEGPFDGPLAGRSVRWCMHRLGMELLALDERDPAALAFAGLGPDRDPPSRGEEPPTRDEAAALVELAAALAARLRERLRPGEPAEPRLAALLLRETC